MRASETESKQTTRTKKTASLTDATMKPTATNQPRTRRLRTSSPRSARCRTFSNALMWTSATELSQPELQVLTQFPEKYLISYKPPYTRLDR